MKKVYLKDGQLRAVNMFRTNEIYTTSSYTYICKETSSGEWLIMRIDNSGVFRYASKMNNDSVTNYADARTDVETLTYGTYDEAQ